MPSGCEARHDWSIRAAIVTCFVPVAAWAQAPAQAVVPLPPDAAEQRLRTLEESSRRKDQQIEVLQAQVKALAQQQQLTGLDTSHTDDDVARPDQEEPVATPYFFDVNRYKAQPYWPGAIRIPNSDISIQIGGFTWLDVINDFDQIGSPDQFIVAAIPVGAATTANTGFELGARQSRLFIKTEWPWKVAPVTTYIDVDFFDPNNDFTLHLRDAYGELGRSDGVRFYAGQTWSAYMDANILPSQLDYAAPVGIVNVLQPQARLVVPLTNTQGAGWIKRLEWGLAAEVPDPQVTVPTNVEATAFSDWPDMITGVRWDHAHGHVVIAGVFRDIGILTAGGNRDSTLGYGGTFTGSLEHFWRKDQLLWSVGGGRAVAAYYGGSRAAGLDLDAFLQPDGSLSATSLFAMMGSYQHYWWSDRYSSTVTYSLLRMFDLDAGTSSTFQRAQYLGANVQWFPQKRLMIGIEYLFGQRRNRDEQSADNSRLQASTQVKF
jgi:hypothetical protein